MQRSPNSSTFTSTGMQVVTILSSYNNNSLAFLQVWQLCLGVDEYTAKLPVGSDIFDLNKQQDLRADCQKFVGEYGMDFKKDLIVDCSNAVCYRQSRK